jgi:hypothetical protein
VACQEASLPSALGAWQAAGAAELAVAGLPPAAGETPKARRVPAVTLRSKDLSTKRPASDKQISQAPPSSSPPPLLPAAARPRRDPPRAPPMAQFEARMRELNVPARPLPTEANVALYNQCRGSAVLLVELESKLKRLEYEKGVLASRKQQFLSGGGPPPSASHSKRERDDRRSHHGPSHKRSHH